MQQGRTQVGQPLEALDRELGSPLEQVEDTMEDTMVTLESAQIMETWMSWLQHHEILRDLDMIQPMAKKLTDNKIMLEGIHDTNDMHLVRPSSPSTAASPMMWHCIVCLNAGTSQPKAMCTIVFLFYFPRQRTWSALT